MGSVYSDQSQAGAATQKTTEWMVTPALLPSARQILGTLRDASYRRNTIETSLIGAATGDYSKSTAAARYTPQQWERLIRVVLSNTSYITSPMKPRLVLTGAEQDALRQTKASQPPPASLTRPRREATDARYTVTGELQAAPESTASLGKTRRLRGHVSYVGDDLVAMHIIQQQPPLRLLEALRRRRR